jgi:hypothetical protein
MNCFINSDINVCNVTNTWNVASGYYHVSLQTFVRILETIQSVDWDRRSKLSRLDVIPVRNGAHTELYEIKK